MMNELIITEHGVKIGKKQRRLQISGKDVEKELSIENLDLLIITGNASITSSAIRLASEHNVPIHVANYRGKPISTLYPSDATGNPRLKIEQLKARREDKGLKLAKKFATTGMTNKAVILRSLDKTRSETNLKNDGEKIMDLIEKLEDIKGEISLCRAKIMNLEGRAASVYFDKLSEILPEKLYKGRRGRRPPTDAFNAGLSYGYGILYPRVHKSLIFSGLNPYIGFLHAASRRRPALEMDLIEEFRQPTVDRAIINLAVRNQLKEKHTESRKDGVFLNKKGRKLIANEVMKKLSEKKEHKGRNTKVKRHIRNQAISLANYILEEGNYKGYSPSRI